MESDNAREQLKSSKGSIWRDKIKDKASKLAKGHKPSRSQTEQEVSDFLRPSSSSSLAHPPRLDISPPVTDSATLESRPVPGRYVLPPRKKRWKPPGLHVGFAEEPPQIIGEGGDDAEIPTRDVNEAWKASGKTFEPSNSDSAALASRKNSLPTPDLLQPGFDPRTSRRSSIQRTPTRHATPDGWSQKRLSMSLEEGLVQATKDESNEPSAPVKQSTHPLPIPPDVEPLATEPLPFASRPYMPTIPQDRQHPSSSRLSVEQPPVHNHLEQFEDKPYVAASHQAARRSSEDDRGSPSDFIPFHPKRQPTLPVLDPIPPRLPALKMHDDLAKPGGPSDDYEFFRSPISTEVPPPELRLPQEERVPRQDQPRAMDRFPSPQAPAVRDRRSRQASPIDGRTMAAAEAASEELFSRLQHLRGMFRLASEKIDDTTERTLVYWLRASSWWFLRGRTMLEGTLRSSRKDTMDRPGSRGGEPEIPQNKQCYVDLAKSWWIMEEVLPDFLDAENTQPSRHPDRIDGLNSSQLLNEYRESWKEMQLFALSLEKRNLFPPPALMIQGADPLIWVPYPRLPPGVFAATAGLDPRSLSKYIAPGRQALYPMPLADTSRHFCYGRVFGEVELMGDSDADEDAHFPSMISIARDREQSHVEILLTSQDGQINVHVQTDKRVGPTWEDVEWKIKTHSLRIRLSRDLKIIVRLWESDFKTLWGIHDYNRRVEADRQPRKNEEVLYKEYVAAFHYIPPQGSQTSFPTSLVKNCQVRLFQMNTTINDGSGERNIFTGYRIVAVTPPYVKTVSSISRSLGDGTPILVSKLTGEGGAPALGFAVYEAGKRESIYLTFDSPQARALLLNVLSGADPSPDECFSEDLPFESLAITNLANVPPDEGDCALPSSIQWQNLRIINQGASLESAPILFSNRLRISITSNFGTLTDRINLSELVNLYHLSSGLTQYQALET